MPAWGMPPCHWQDTHACSLEHKRRNSIVGTVASRAICQRSIWKVQAAPVREIQERKVGSSRPRKMYSMMATTSGMLARKQMIVSTGTYCMSVTAPLSNWTLGYVGVSGLCFSTMP